MPSTTPTRFLATDNERHTHVLWEAHTRLMDCWNRTPRLLIMSPEPKRQDRRPGDQQCPPTAAIT
jgi:hypothetical protein